MCPPRLYTPGRCHEIDYPPEQWHAEGLGCPGPTRFWMTTSPKKFYIQIHLRKFLTTFFSHLSKFFQNLHTFLSSHLPKILTTFFLVVFTIFLDNAPPYPGCPGHELFFSYFLCIYPYSVTFTYTFSENSLVGFSLWMPGTVAPPGTPLCTPLLPN